MDGQTRAAIESFAQPRQLAEERLYLETFRQNIYPVYGELGFSFTEAVIAFRLGAIERDIAALREIAEEQCGDEDAGL